MPLLIQAPEGAPRRRAASPVLNETVANIDIAPTILQLAKATPCAPDGRAAGRWTAARWSRSCAGASPRGPRDRDLVIELARIGLAAGRRRPRLRLLRASAPPGPSGAGTFYVEHTSAVAASGACEPVDERELYDLAADPFQLDEPRATRTAARASSRRTRARRSSARSPRGSTRSATAPACPGRDPCPPAGTSANERDFAAAVHRASLAALARRSAVPAPARPRRSRAPNIVMVLTDDQTLGRLQRAHDARDPASCSAGSGTTFGEAIVTTPLCCPSRASLITGQYGHNNGVLRNNYDACAARTRHAARLARSTPATRRSTSASS